MKKKDSKFSAEGKNDMKRFESQTPRFVQPTLTNYTLVRSISVSYLMLKLFNFDLIVMSTTDVSQKDSP